MFENEVIYIPSKSFKLYELMQNDEDDFDSHIEEYLANDKMKLFDKSDFKDDYLEKLQRDYIILEKLVGMWDSVDYDPKLDKFKTVLDTHPDEKIVVFTESKQTALYLEQQLKNYKKVLTVHGGNREKLREKIRENFDANYESKKDDYNVIISTDTLSEGVNMHRSNIIYNYDIPWNSTRLMQRIGRINRIGTNHEEIFIYNFKPTAQSEELIELSKKAFVKLQTFHNTLGEDSQIYSKDEKVSSVSLYENTTEKPDEELKFLQEIRSYKEAYPNKYKTLKNLPKKVRVQRADSEFKNSSFVFIKNDFSKNYYIANDSTCEAVNFVKMATALKCKQDTKAIVPMNECHYEQVQKATKFYEDELIDVIIETTNIKVTHKTDRQAIVLLKSWQDKQHVDVQTAQIFIKTIQEGKLQNLSKEIVKISKKDISMSLKMQELRGLQVEFNLLEKDRIDVDGANNIEIILSETFV